MIVVFRNNCRISVRVCVNSKNVFDIKPYGKENLEFVNEQQLHISISPNKQSTIRTDVFHIVLNTSYLCSAITEVSELIITREKIRIAPNAFYERVFLSSPHATCILNSINLLDEEELKKKYKRLCRLRLFVYEPLLDDFLSGPILAIIIGIILMCGLDNWKIAIPYFICAYWFLVLMSYVIKHLVQSIFKRHSLFFDEKKEFYDYINPISIYNYYATPDRKPFQNEIETN